jgi:hypothetical protein
MTFLLGIFTNKYVLIGIAVIAALTGVYFYGSSTGYTKGHDAGYTTAWNTQQDAINKLVTAQNAETAAQNTKISALELSIDTAQQQIAAAVASASEARSTVITRYVQANPTVAKACGWQPATVQTINQILEAQ